MHDRRRRFEAQALPHLDAAYSLARWLSRSASDADDIVQDAFLRAYRSFDRLRGADVKPWLLAIVRNCCWTAASRRSRWVVGLPADGWDDVAGGSPASAEDPLQEAIRAEDARSLDAAIAALPAGFREVLILREVENLSYREIATVTGAPIGTVMSRLARARVALKNRWRGRTGGPSDGLR
jgi:RNA polymerase sigma factor (sigma-70 family)